MTIAKKNEKVYIISKSYGDSLQQAANRQKGYGTYHTEMINVDGKNLIAMVGFFNQSASKRHCSCANHQPPIFILDYHTPVDSGDFYYRCDFLTESDLKIKSFNMVLEDSLFEL
jgi:hypothetical protein